MQFVVFQAAFGGIVVLIVCFLLKRCEQGNNRDARRGFGGRNSFKNGRGFDCEILPLRL